MQEAISLEQILENVKLSSEEARITVEAAEKTLKIIEKIVQTRESSELSQRDLAQKCGMQQPALARIESGKVIPKISTLIKMAEALGITIEALTPMEKQQNSKQIVVVAPYCISQKNYQGEYVYGSQGQYQYICSK